MGSTEATTGLILMTFGIIGAVLSIAAWVSRSYSHHRSTAVTQGPYGHVLRRDDVDSTTTKLGA